MKKIKISLQLEADSGNPFIEVKFNKNIGRRNVDSDVADRFFRLAREKGIRFTFNDDDYNEFWISINDK